MWHAVGAGVSKRSSVPALQILRCPFLSRVARLCPEERANLRLRTLTLLNLFSPDKQHLCGGPQRVPYSFIQRRRIGRQSADDLPPVSDPIRILLVERQQLVADALEALLSRQQGMTVVGSFGCVADSTPNAQEMRPDIVILGFRLNDGMAASAAMAITKARSEAKLIFLTDDDHDNVLLAAIEAGASAVVRMSAATKEVIEAIRVVADGASLIPPRTIAKLLDNRRSTDGVRDSLTGREREILRLMSEGTSNRDMAARLGISYTTVRSHIRNLSRKLAAHSKLEVVARAKQLDLVGRQRSTRMAVA
jgi:two-component system response regulator DevR